MFTDVYTQPASPSSRASVQACSVERWTASQLALRIEALTARAHALWAACVRDRQRARSRDASARLVG